MLADGERTRNMGKLQVYGDPKCFVETPMRIKDAPLTLRRKLRTSFVLSYLLLHPISICGFVVVSKPAKVSFE